MITSFSHIYHRVRDLDESIEFYQKLGFYLLRRYTMDGRESAYVGLGDVMLEMSPVRDASGLPADGERRLGMTVDDLDKTLADLNAKGIPTEAEPWAARTFWGRQAGIKDPSGYFISLREWREPDNPRFEGWQPDSEGVVRVK